MTMKGRLNNPLPACVLMALNTGYTTEAEFDLMKFELYIKGLGALQVKQVDGSFDGIQEKSYCINLPRDANQLVSDAIKAIARKYNQEEIWILEKPESYSTVRGVYQIKGPDFDAACLIGNFVPCTQSKAAVSKGFTFDANTGQHYTLEEI